MRLKIPVSDMMLFAAKLRDSELADLAELLGDSRMSIAEAPEIGCMAIVPEHCFEIETPAEQFCVLESLPAQRKNELLAAVVRFFQPRHPELNIAAVEFFKRP